MVAVELGGDWVRFRWPQLLNELLRAGDAAEGDRVRRCIFNSHAAPDAPDGLRVEFSAGEGSASARDHNGVWRDATTKAARAGGRRAAVGRERLLARARTMSKSRASERCWKPSSRMCSLQAELAFSEKASLITAFADNHRAAEALRDQDGFVTEVARRSVWIDREHAASLASVAARENIERNAALLQQTAEQNDERSLPRPADGNISDADDGTGQSAGLENRRGRTGRSESGLPRVDCAERVHAGLALVRLSTPGVPAVSAA